MHKTKTKLIFFFNIFHIILNKIITLEEKKISKVTSYFNTRFSPCTKNGRSQSIICRSVVRTSSFFFKGNWDCFILFDLIHVLGKVIEYTFLSFIFETKKKHSFFTYYSFYFKRNVITCDKKEQLIYLTEINIQFHKSRLRAEIFHSVIF